MRGWDGDEDSDAEPEFIDEGLPMAQPKTPSRYEDCIRWHSRTCTCGMDAPSEAMGADMIPQHGLRHRQGRFGRSEAHCACGAESPATTPEGVSDWYREHLALIASPIPPAPSSAVSPRVGTCSRCDDGRRPCVCADAAAEAAYGDPDCTTGQPLISQEVLDGLTVAGARAFWALKDLEKQHESLRADVMTIASDPHLEWDEARTMLMAALNAK